MAPGPREIPKEFRGWNQPDGVIVRGDVVKRNRHKKVLNHNYLPPLAWGTPSFIKKETAGKPAGEPPKKFLWNFFWPG